MSDLENSGLDLVRELRLRQWARQHFVPLTARKATWHAVVLDEMRRRDAELTSPSLSQIGDSQRLNAPLAPAISDAVTSRITPSDLKAHDDQFWQSTSRFVPLAPTTQWSLHAASSAVPRPHYRDVQRQNLYFTEDADIAEFA